MFKRRYHWFLAVLFSCGERKTFVNAYFPSKTKSLGVNNIEDLRAKAAENNGIDPKQLALLNIIYLGKGGDLNVRTMETSQPGTADDE